MYVHGGLWRDTRLPRLHSMDDGLAFLILYSVLRSKQRSLRRRARYRKLRMLVNVQRYRSRARFQLTNFSPSRMVLVTDKVRNPRTIWAVPRDQRWFDQAYDNNAVAHFWKSDFRMRKETFEQVVELVRPYIEREDTVFRTAIPVPKRVAIALWRLATGDSYRATGLQFGVGKSTAISITHEFCQALNHCVEIIKFPRTSDETALAIEAFSVHSDVPQTVGAIDVTHFEILAPEDNPIDFYDRKKRYSVSMQAVVGANLKFMHVAIGYPGSMHDARVLRHSEIYELASNGTILSAPTRQIQGQHVRPLLIGDGAYAISSWIIIPYPHNALLDVAQRRFNRTLSGARSTVERAFGLLKGRWRCLLKRNDSNLENISATALACCILHNICQEAGEEFGDEEYLQEIMAEEREYRNVNNPNPVRHAGGYAVREALKLFLR